jgi:hypothetical protein
MRVIHDLDDPCTRLDTLSSFLYQTSFPGAPVSRQHISRSYAIRCAQDMVMNRRHDESQRLVRDSSLDGTSSDFELDDFDVQEFKDQRHSQRFSLSSLLPWKRSHSTASRLVRSSRWMRILSRLTTAFGLILLVTAILTPIFNPSYTNRPAHYTGTNPNNEKVFIAANIVDEALIRGAWGQAVVKLVELLGQDNVFLSIYENDSGEGTAEALNELKDMVRCKEVVPIL